MNHNLEKRVAFLTEEKMNRVHAEHCGIKIADDPVVQELFEETFPKCNFVTENFHENRDIHHKQGKVRAYLGNIGKIDRDVKIIRKALKRQRDDRVVKITTQPKYPLSYTFLFHDPFKNDYYDEWKDIEVHVKKRHLEIINKEKNPYNIYFRCLKLALSEHLNRRGRVKHKTWAGGNVSLHIKDWEYGHLVEVLPSTSKFIKHAQDTSWIDPEKFKFEESSFVARVPEVYVGTFKEVKHSWLVE